MSYPNRCKNCPACRRVEQVKPTILRCANPPFSHATDDVVLVWNQTLFDNPCERWTNTEVEASRAPMLALTESIRPRPAKRQFRITVDLTLDNDPQADKTSHSLLSAVRRACYSADVAPDPLCAVAIVEIANVDGHVASYAVVAGVDSANLAVLVHQAASVAATKVNSLGLAEQVMFLCEQLGAKAVITEINKIIPPESRTNG